MKKQILVVDDSTYMRATLKNILSDAGYGIAGEAKDGEEAMELAKALKPDLITLDIIMPGNSGLDLLKELVKEVPQSKVVMVSAVGQEAIMDEAIKGGADAYIVKPFADQNVIETIEKTLK